MRSYFLFLVSCLGECLRSVPDGVGVHEGILNRSGVFVDAMSLLPLWPVEIAHYRILVCKVCILLDCNSL